MKTMQWMKRVLVVLALACGVVQANQVLDFTATDQRVVVPNFTGFGTNALTVECWVKTSDMTRDAGIVSYATEAGNDHFLLLNANNLEIFVNDSSAASGISIADGQWHHVAVTWQFSGITRLYVDGELSLNTLLSPFFSLTSTGYLVLGDDQDSIGGGFQASQTFIGQLDDVRIWNVVRNQQAIRDTICTPLTGAEANLVSYFPCDVLEDLSVATAGTNDIRDVAGSNHGGAENGLALIAADPIVDSGICRVHNITQATSYFTIQSAINDAVSNDIIEADPGTYLEAINFNGKAITLRSASGIRTNTVIDGNGASHAVECSSGEGPDTILESFTITGGSALDPQGINSGGGMFNFQSSPTVKDCLFAANTALFGGGMINHTASHPAVTDCSFSGNFTGSGGLGGGMYNFLASHPVIMKCTFAGNTASVHGGGIYNDEDCGPTVLDCDFINNTASGGGGGGMWNYLSAKTASIRNCDFINNTSSSTGGAILNWEHDATIANCRFIDNMGFDGGAISTVLCGPNITNCMFSGNIAQSWGGGVFNNTDCYTRITHCSFSGNVANEGGGIYTRPPLVVTNSIFWDNTANIGPEIWDFSTGGDATVQFSCVKGGWTGIGGHNISTDPLFAGAAFDDLRLQAGSPAIDAANSAFSVLPFATDLDGNQRIIDDPATVDTGIGFPDVTDMGAYEFGSTPPCDSTLEGDINCDGVVDYLDMALMAGNWLATI